MTKLITRTSVNGATLTGAQAKTALVGMVDALNSSGIQEGNRTTVTATGTLTLTQCGLLLVDCTAGSVTLTLPASGTSADDAVYDFRRVDSSTTNTLTVQRAGADTIDGAASVTIAAGGTLMLQMPAGATTWRVRHISGATAAAARKALAVGSVLLYDSGALSGVANHAITSVISSAFRTYELEITDFKLATAGGDLQLQVSANNGSSYLAGASDYSHMRVGGTTAGGSPVLTVSGGDTKWVLAAGIGNSASFPAHSVVRLRAQGGVGSLRASMHHKTLVYTGSDAADLSGSGYVNTLNFDAIRIQPSAGNFDGRIRLIGIA